MSSSNCCFLTCIDISQETGQVVWHSHLLKTFPRFVVIHMVKGFGIVNKAEVDVFGWTPGVGDGQGGLACCNSWRCKESDTTERLNWTEDVFLELSCFFNDPVDVGNLISCSSAFSKSSLNIWKFTVHVLLRSSLKNCEHYFASIWDECIQLWMWLAIEVKPNTVKNNIA